MIYADHNATTPVRDEVREAVASAAVAGAGNPASLHRLGQDARRLLEVARRRVASAVGAEPRDVIFTSGGTESDNLAVLGGALGAADERADEGRRHVVASSVEHHAVLAAVDVLARSGWRGTHAPVDPEGRVDLGALDRLVTPDTVLVSVMTANNETGVVQDVAEVVRIAHAAGARAHTDAVQALGRMPVDVGSTGVDYLSLSGHKIYGPRGIGALVARRGAPLTPLVVGGGQEAGRRGGTPDVAAAVGLGVACELAATEQATYASRLADLTRAFEEAVRDACPGLVVAGGGAPRVPGTSAVLIPDTDAAATLIALDLADVAVSSGAACTTGALEPSHVLAAMGVDPALARSAIRVSFGRQNTRDEALAIATRLGAIARRREDTP